MSEMHAVCIQIKRERDIHTVRTQQPRQLDVLYGTE